MVCGVCVAIWCGAHSGKKKKSPDTLQSHRNKYSDRAEQRNTTGSFKDGPIYKIYKWYINIQKKIPLKSMEKMVCLAGGNKKCSTIREKHIKLYFHIIPRSKFESNCIKSLNVKPKRIKIIGNNKVEYFYSPQW